MKTLLWLVGLLLSVPTLAQQREMFEFQRNLPVYADSLIADLHYPLAWEHSGIRRFDFHATTPFLPICSFLMVGDLSLPSMLCTTMGHTSSLARKR